MMFSQKCTFIFKRCFISHDSLEFHLKREVATMKNIHQQEEF